MPVMTRKAAAQDVELRLRTTIHELEASERKCQALLEEREESEREVEKVIYKNTSLKQELVDLHRLHLNVVDERDQLRVVTDGFKNCSNLYEEALCKIRDLEDELIHANIQILKLQKDKERSQIKETDHLFNELLNKSCNPHSITTIDLTENSLLKHNYSHKMSQNKIKKYARLNKIIKKCNKFKKQQNHFSKNIQLRKERVTLMNKLKNYQIKLEDSINIYEIDTQRLQTEIQALDDSLKSLYNKYLCSQHQIKEHILATNELVDRVDSLTLSNTQCTCQRGSNLDALQPEATEDPSQVVSALDCIPNQDIPDTVQELSQARQSAASNVSSCSSQVCYQSVMFSDSIGRGLGKLVSDNFSFNTQNYCLPGTSFKQIITSITGKQYDSNTNITVFVGDSSQVRKEVVTDSVSKLLKIKCNKIILCAFPYFETLSNRQNNYIHMLNKHMHFLASHYSDKLIFFDTNSFVVKLKSTRNTVYLPIRFRHKIARLLAYINSDISSMSKSCTIINTAIISNNSNVQVVTQNNCSTNAITIYNDCTKEDPCVTMASSCPNVGSTSRGISLPGDGLGVLGLTLDVNLN